MALAFSVVSPSFFRRYVLHREGRNGLNGAEVSLQCMKQGERLLLRETALHEQLEGCRTHIHASSFPLFAAA